MKLSKTIKTATLFSVMALGVHSAAMANDKRADQPGAAAGPHVRVISGSGPERSGGAHVLLGDGSVTTISDSIPAKPAKPATKPVDTFPGGENGLLLPAVQKVREAAR